MQTHDYAYCGKISQKTTTGEFDGSNPTTDYGCYVQLALWTENPALCAKTDFKEECLNELKSRLGSTPIASDGSLGGNTSSGSDISEATGSWNKYCYQTINYSQYGCTEMHVGDKKQMGDWVVRIADVGVASEACGLEHTAILDILAENNSVVGQLEVCPGLVEYPNQRDSDGRIRFYVLKTAQSMSALAKWAVICDRVPDCS